MLQQLNFVILTTAFISVLSQEVNDYYLITAIQLFTERKLIV